jgi:ribonucleoside-diphosphate reductase beta chain
VAKEDPRFAEAKAECEAEVYALYMDVIREEKQWADYLFNKGPVIGLNANILKDFVDYTAVGALKEIGIKYLTPAPKTTPIPWFNKHVNVSNKQTALQESESTNYVIGVMSDSLDYDALPNYNKEKYESNRMEQGLLSFLRSSKGIIRTTWY